MERKTIVGLGEALWDMLPQGKRIGGAPINFAYHAGCMNHRAYAVSAVGHDELGTTLTSQLEEKNINLVIPQVDRPTGTVRISLDDKGIPQYDICQGAAWDYIPFTPQMEELAARADAVCFGSLAQRNATSRETIHRFLKSMSEDKETLKIFDVNLRQSYYSEDVVRDSLKLCNALKINDEELPIVSRLLALQEKDAESMCRGLLRSYSLKMVIYTCGTKGSSVFTPDGTSFAETPCVEVADTVGAGDSFTGAFVGSLLNGKSVSEAHHTAVRISAYVCTQQGAMPDIPPSLQ